MSSCKQFSVGTFKFWKLKTVNFAFHDKAKAEEQKLTQNRGGR